MKKLISFLIAAVVLSATSVVSLQTIQNEMGNQKSAIEKNPFLAERRHGASFISNNGNMLPDNLVAETNPFLVDKRHGSVFMVSRNEIDKSANQNLTAERNPFLVERRHGAVVMVNNKAAQIPERTEYRNIFLEQKRHQ